MNKYIVVEGNIGAGKTTLVRLLADCWSTPSLFEQFMDNPFLPRFYDKPERYAFSLETSFLAERYRQMQDELSEPDVRRRGLVADYSFYKSLIFARRTLDPEEFGLFSQLFGIINQRLPQPHLFVYLSTPVPRLLQQIAERGRDYEQKIEGDYLHFIDESYRQFMAQASGLKCLLLNTAEVDFVQHPQDFDKIKSLIEREYPYGITECTP
jgi:deoxyadenosine/deoxycytidine kinase